MQESVIRRTPGNLTLILFAAAIFSPAFLIFLVQPMVGKLILPWFGGGPGIWTTCLMFYQVALFLGYLYAYGLVRFLPTRFQVLGHGVVCLAAFLALPVLPGVHWKPIASTLAPSHSILTMLTANVGLPFLTLAATGPLVQSWFARRYPDASPYPLYSVSNLGSLGALMCFPLLVEPLFPMREASQIWSAGFALAVVLIVASGYHSIGRPGQQLSQHSLVAPNHESTPTSRAPHLLWISIPVASTMLLMAVTNKLCLDLASFPFLWIVPLALYLISFVFSFGSERPYRRTTWTWVAIAALLVKYLFVFLLAPKGSYSAFFWSMYIQVPLFGVILFSLCMLLHGELYRLRPPADSLTSFYLGISGGGALGGIFAGLLAPLVFNDYLELQLGFALAGALLFIQFRKDESSWIYRGNPLWRSWLVALPAILALSLSIFIATAEEPGLIHKERNFFGVHRVMQQETENPERARRVLKHGTTIHGAQLLGPRYRTRPISYYGVSTGIGLAMKKGLRPGPLKTGIIGMGAGSLAAYGKPGDEIKFYEIDPTVLRIASDDRYFSFLKDSPANIEIVQGDARLSLEDELNRGKRQGFDLLIVDAFSSDAIPFHLMTREAIELYLEHLAPDGVIAFHISNRHFDLAPVLYKISDALALDALSIDSPALGLKLSTSSKWLFLSPDPGQLTNFARESRNRMDELGLDSNRLIVGKLSKESYIETSLWTDAFNSPIDVMRGPK